MASSLDQVLTSLNSVYQPQVDSIQKQQAALPAQYDAQAAGIDASKNNAFSSILDGARARGTGIAFGGIPLQEQAQYTASTYAPALANLRNTQDQQQKSLTDSLNTVNQNKYTQAIGIDQYNQTMAENQRQFNATQDFQKQQLAQQAAQAALARSSASSSGLSYGGGGGGQQAQAGPAAFSAFKNGKDGSGGTNFTNSQGKSISAGQYAQLTGAPIDSVLYSLGHSGDRYAQQAYNEIQKNQSYYAKNPNALKSEFSSLFWGT